MKIVHLTVTGEFAGAERYAAELARQQAENGHDVTLIIKRQSRENAKRWQTEAGDKVHVVQTPFWLPQRFIKGWLPIALKGEGVHIIHAHLGRAARAIPLAGKLLGIPTVASLHLAYRAKDYQHVGGLICIADWQKQGLIDKNYKGKSTRVWNWVSPPPAKHVSGAGSALRGSWQIPENTFLFLSCGRLVRQKGMDLLIKAFQRAFPAEDSVPVALKIMGQGKDKEELQTLIGADSRIELAGYRHDIWPAYAAADAYVSAARYEPFGLTILEAMAAGCRLVLTRTDGPSEFLINEEKVHWAQTDDVETLAQALKSAYLEGPQPPGSPRQTYDMKPFNLARATKAIEAFYAEMGAKGA